MARTEKKFGQVNAVPGSTYSTLVASSANRRNVIVNATATAADNLHLVTSSGAISATSSSPNVSISLNTPSWTGGTFSGANGMEVLAINPTGTRGFKSAQNNAGASIEYFTLSPTSSAPATFASTGYGIRNGSDAGTAAPSQYHSLYAPAGSNLIIRPSTVVGRYYSYTNNIKWASNGDNFIACPNVDPAYVSGSSGYNAGVIAWGTHSSRTVNAGSSSGSPTNYGLPSMTYSGTGYNLTNTSQIRSAHRTGAYYTVGVHYDYGTTTVSGTGINNAVMIYSAPETTTTFPTNWTAAIGYYNNLSMPIGEVFANWGLVDYDATYGKFACPSASIALTDANMYFVTVNTAGTTLNTGSTITSAPAGFRIVDNSTYSTNYGLGYLTGSVTYPSAPTGVTVPSSKFPTVSVKFSPNGKYVAVAYDRDYSSTGNTNSVVVIYTRQNDGTYSHTHSSAANVPYRPQHFDAMAWTPDNSGIVIRGTDNKLTAWYPGLTPSSSSYSAFTYSGAYPATPAYIGSVSGASTSATYSLGTSTNMRSGGLSFLSGITGSTWLWSYPAVTQTNTDYGMTSDSFGRIAQVSPSAVLTATNYVNTVVNGLSIPANSVTQISNIVLEANERLEVDATTGSRMNLVAYGVEIS